MGLFDGRFLCDDIQSCFVCSFAHHMVGVTYFLASTS